MAQVINLNGTWKFQIGDKSTWVHTNYDDSNWENIHAPTPWEDEGFNGYDGFAWYRKKFDGNRLDKDENYTLNLGYIDDCDEVFLNGVLIGLSGSMPPKFKTAYNSERIYTLPNELINYAGDNTLAIRVFDVTQGGGIVDGDLGIYRAPKNRMIVDLHGLWYFHLSRDGESIKSSDPNEWEKIMVPSPWEHQGFPRYDGYAWYKKSFKIDDKYIDSDDDLVLLLGKIDDFDKTFLNGKLIGTTNDKRRYGDSRSFSQDRVYSIPKNLLRKGALNTIDVQVEDMGNVGGIYEGPIGITTRTAYERYFR
jgi:hypothetical protein